jgi:hypothetical protein
VRSVLVRVVRVWVALAVIVLEIGRAFIGFPDWLLARLHR